MVNQQVFARARKSTNRNSGFLYRPRQERGRNGTVTSRVTVSSHRLSPSIVNIHAFCVKFAELTVYQRTHTYLQCLLAAAPRGCRVRRRSGPPRGPDRVAGLPPLKRSKVSRTLGQRQTPMGRSNPRSSLGSRGQASGASTCSALTPTWWASSRSPGRCWCWV
jgi:hypothetical protein